MRSQKIPAVALVAVMLPLVAPALGAGTVRISGPSSRRFDVRVEAYNLFNRVHFNIPGFTLGAADFGEISSARAARTLQLGTRLSF